MTGASSQFTTSHSAAGLVCLIYSIAAFSAPASAEPSWRALAPGLDLAVVNASKPSHLGDSIITIVRADPSHWQLALGSLSDEMPAGGMTARQWAEKKDWALAINAGMFAEDYRTHVGYFASGGKVLNDNVNRYQSVAVFDPREESLPGFRIIDLDLSERSFAEIRKQYGSVIQNLRLIRRPGENRWRDRGEAWSEAALGEDSAGNMLFIFARSPFTMHQFNREILSAGIDLVAAQHLEGGPEAQLFLKLGDFELNQFGSYETRFKEDDGNPLAWPIPNVIGIFPRSDP